MAQFEAILLGGLGCPFEQIMTMLVGGGEYYQRPEYKKMVQWQAVSQTWRHAWREYEREYHEDVKVIYLSGPRVPTYLPAYLCIYIPTYVPTYLSTYLPTYVRTVPTYLPTCQSPTYTSTHLLVH